MGGVAYISLEHIVKFMFAHGIAVNNIFVQVYKTEAVEFPSDRVNNVEQCRRAMDWKHSVAKKLEDIDGVASVKRCLACWTTMWKDGFGHGRVKNFRGSTVAQTLTISPPKDMINAGHNTFLNACGLKQALGWSDVQRRFEEEIRMLTRNLRPNLVHHGVLQKILPVFFEQMVIIEDRPERHDNTATISYASDYHRCFEKIGQIQACQFQMEGLCNYLVDRSRGNNVGSEWGWCYDYLVRVKGRGLFPSCMSCRRNRLQLLQIIGMSKKRKSGNTGLNTSKYCTD
jgi:hypothetical protein